MIGYPEIYTRFKNIASKWGEMFNPTHAGFVGLDIGNGAVKLIALQKNQDGWLATAAAYALVEPAQDQAVREENIVRAIHECFVKAEITASHNAVCGLSGPEVAVRSFSFPSLPDEALEQAIQLEAQQVCAFDPGHSIVDFQLIEEDSPLRPDENQAIRKGYFVVGLEDAVNQKIRLAQQAHIKPTILDVNSLAALNCLCQLEDSLSNEMFALLDVGHTHSYLAILGSDGMPFVRDLTCSSQQIIATISEQSKKTVPEVRKGLAEDIFDDERPEMALKTACGKLIADVLETLRFYSLQGNTEKVSRVYLCGGLASAKSFVRLMKQALPVQVMVFDPSMKIHCVTGDKTEKILKQYGPDMAVAAGLAMRSEE
jgi:type IV pilus assembly protein PilM